MRKIYLYAAISLNGMIATKDGKVDWLDSIPNPDESDYGYAEFYSQMDVTIQGRKTYQQILDWDIPFPYPDTKNYVFTTNPDLEDTEDVEFVHRDHLAFLKTLKRSEGKDIWLVGGALLNGMLLEAGLIDELIIFVMPVLIPEGIPLFQHIPADFHLDLLESKSFASGVSSLHYSIPHG